MQTTTDQSLCSIAFVGSGGICSFTHFFDVPKQRIFFSSRTRVRHIFLLLFYNAIHNKVIFVIRPMSGYQGDDEYMFCILFWSVICSTPRSRVSTTFFLVVYI